MRQQESLNLFPRYLLPLKFRLFGQLHTFPVFFLCQYSFTPASLLTLGNHSRQQHSFRKPQRAKTYFLSGPGSACAVLCRRPDVSAQGLSRRRVTPASPGSSPAPSGFCACSRLRPPCVTEWPPTPWEPLTCRGGARCGGARSGAQGCGREQS